MKAQTTLASGQPQALAARVPGKPIPPPPTIPQRPPVATKAARLDPQAKPDDSAQFRADLLQRSQAPLDAAWGHGGLND
jgi:hypothetical protein